MTRFPGLVCCIALLGSTWGCTRHTVPDTREADERAVRAWKPDFCGIPQPFVKDRTAYPQT